MRVQIKYPRNGKADAELAFCPAGLCIAQVIGFGNGFGVRKIDGKNVTAGLYLDTYT